MRIIHFSDSHLSPNNGILKSQRLVDSFIKTLKGIHAQKTIDLFVFSGDMIDKGGKGFSSMDDAFAIYRKFIIDKILFELGMSQSRFVFTCGNHDVERGKDSKFVETGLLNDLDDIAALDDFVRDPDSIKNVQRIESFNKFRNAYYSTLSDVEYYETPFQANLILTIEGKRVCISILNSSWRCWDSDNDKGRILFGQAQIIDSKKYLDDADIRIGVSHHDYSWFNTFERPNLPKLIAANYDMYFSGHTHNVDSEMICRPEGNTFIFTAPGLMHANLHELDRDYRNGFMIIDYDKDHLKLEATQYFQTIDESFQIDHNYAENGVWKHDIPAGALAEMNNKILNVYDTLFEKIPSLNTHLIGYSTSTHAPKTVEDIFVMPTLSYKEQSNNDVNPINTITINSIEELLSIKGNILIYGAKESGKSILLDRIFIDILKNRRNENYIPVMFEFSSIKMDILQSIANKWNERTSDAKDILKSKAVILLIDNVDFNNASDNRLKFLSAFLAQYSKVRLIATSMNRGELPFESAEQIDIPFKSVKIESFKSDHIRRLACKWEGVDKENKHIRSLIKYIIKAFSTFRIPCTPFSVTLLLWILEKGGECQPSNMALLLDGFITELLKDCNGDFTKDKFDLHNKKRLIANIAYNIHLEEQECLSQDREYHYTFGSFVKNIEDHLESMELKIFNARQLAHELLKVGLFVHDENTSLVYFRFRCFMEFFLAIKMQMSEEFFVNVLDEVNYLNYTNEIYYFTGLTRDKVSVVANIFSRLKDVFSNLVDAIDRIGKLDNFFIERSIIQAIANEDINLVLPQKHDEEKDNKRNDKFLQHNETMVEEGRKRKRRITPLEEYGKLLLLAMDVLRNTEETEESGFRLSVGNEEKRSKAECFNLVVTMSLYYAIAIYIMGMRIIRENKNTMRKDKITEISTMLFLLPVLHEELLNRHLGTLMLADHIKDMIKQQAASQTTEFQSFVATFMYADLKGKDFMKYVKRFVVSYKRQYIADAIYLKLMYYFYESDNDALDKDLAELMTTVYMKSHKAGNGKKWNRDALLKKYLDSKNKK